MATIRLFPCLLALLCSIPLCGQKKIGDFIESRSNNTAKRGAARTQQYFPVEGGFYCFNGGNRYTRALYGGYTDYRLETSDRPIFAVFKKGYHRNVRFTVNGVPLESADSCAALYRDASREYLVKDRRWPFALRLTALAPGHEECALFAFSWEGGQERPDIRVLVTPLSGKRFHRNGDMGADPEGVFDPAQDDKGMVSSPAVFVPGRQQAFVFLRLNEAVTMDWQDAQRIFDQTLQDNRQLASRIRFSTPDPYINTLGSALSVAADGDWDGQTWLHGCIGWRMPLAGWRAGYLGDVLGWNDRARSHFDAYAKSQVTKVEPVIPHPSQDPKMNMARAEKKWGTQMYSNGYICRNPEKDNQMHHYDMNLNYMDELLWHFCYNADTAYMRKMWPVIKSHLAWEKRNYDPDNDHLYDAYCCIWASDALYYSGGAVTHSSAYNYRGNLLAARIAELIGEDPAPYRAEAVAIRQALDNRLWIASKGHWAEYQDLMGGKRLHESAALWSVYTPIDCGAGSPGQCYQATCYVDRSIPHIPVVADGIQFGATVATSNWLPYSWSINNVAAAEVMHTALAYFEAGRADDAYRLMMANIMDQMYIGGSPANFGQLSFYDAARGECYRDFGDCIGISSRTLLQGLFGIVPDALHGRVVIRPGFPVEWDSASVETPYLSYSFRRQDGKAVYEVKQNFAQPLQVVLRLNLDKGEYRDIVGSSKSVQTFTVEDGCRQVNIDGLFNANVSDIYKNSYLSPRPPYTTLQIPTQGIGEWCHPTLTAEVNDSVFRTLVEDNRFTMAGIPFRTPAEGRNIIYTSLFDNYPDSVVIPLKGRASKAHLLMAGSTNHMQCRIDNGLVIAHYADNTADTLHLVNPDNWCPIEQDYYVDNLAFSVASPRPLRVSFGTGLVSRDLGRALGITEVYGRPIPGGAAQLLTLPLCPDKKLRSLTVRTLSNDVVIGLMAVTLSE